MNRKLLIIFVLSLLVLSACAPAPTTSKDTSQRSAPAGIAPAAPPAPSAAESRGSLSNSGVAPAQPAANAERLVIKNATMTIVVEDPVARMSDVAKMATEANGFVVTSNLSKKIINNTQEVPVTKISIRVPATKLDATLEKIRGLVKNPKTDILTENVTGEDVTDKYTDLRSRLTNLENAEKQLQKIMDSATKTDDVLSVYNRLIQIREQIEVLKGQIRYYEQSSDLSLINVTMESTETVKPLTIGSWQPGGVALSAIQALINVLKFMVNASIWIVLFVIPIGLVIYIPLRLLWMLFKRMRKNSKAKTSIPPVQPPAAG